MDPLLLDPGQWDHLAGLLVDLTAAAGLALTAAFAFLLGHVVLPALAGPTADAGRTDARRRHDNAPAIRWLLDPLAAAAIVAMLVGLGRAIIGAADLLQGVAPQLLI
jgi:hypothetical protein